MAKDSIERIREAEEQARQIVARARREAERILEEARVQAEVVYAESIEGAKQAASYTLDAAREEGDEQNAAHARASEGECGRLLEGAQKKRAAALEAVLRAITEE